MTRWNRVQGDVGDTIVVTLDGVANLDGVDTVEGHVWRQNVAAVTLDAAVTDSATRRVTVELGDADGWLSDAAPGEWLFETVATYLDGSVLTWPQGTPDRIAVRAQGDPSA